MGLRHLNQDDLQEILMMIYEKANEKPEANAMELIVAIKAAIARERPNGVAIKAGNARENPNKVAIKAGNARQRQLDGRESL